MNFREAAIHTNRSTIELKTEFEDILDAMEAIGQNKDITIGLIDFWLNGSTLTNYEIYLDSFKAYKMLTEQGIPPKYIKNALASDSIDKYLLFKNAALNFIGEPLTRDFQELIIKPLHRLYVEPSEQQEAEKIEQLKKGRSTIKALSGNISKTIKELQKIKPYHLAGSDVESILITLEQIEHTITHQLSE